MGRLARVLSFLNVTRRNAKVGDVKVDGGGGANVTVEHFGPTGDVSRPLPDDYTVITKIDGEGREVVVGYLDPQGPQDAAPGDKYIYSRDTNGVIKAKVWLKNTGDAIIANDDATVTLGVGGTVSLTNGVGTIAIDPAGNVNINGVLIDVAGNITTPAAVNAGAVAATGAGGINSAGPVSGTDLTASNAVNGAVANITGAVNAGSVSSTGAVTGAGNTLNTHTHPGPNQPPTPGT